MLLNEVWDVYAAAVSAQGADPREPTPLAAWSGFVATLKQPLSGFVPDRQEDILLFEIGASGLRRRTGDVAVRLDRRFFLGEEGDETYALTIRWVVEDDSQLHAAEAQIMGHGPAAEPGEELLTTDAFIDTVARHRGLRRLEELAPIWVRASFDGL